MLMNNLKLFAYDFGGVCGTGFVVAGIHAFLLLRYGKNNRFHRLALGIALTVGGIVAFLIPVSGDILAKAVAKNQPIKLAARVTARLDFRFPRRTQRLSTAFLP